MSKNYKDHNYKVFDPVVTFSSMNRKRKIMERQVYEADDDITDFTEAMAVINYIKRTM